MFSSNQAKNNSLEVTMKMISKIWIKNEKTSVAPMNCESEYETYPTLNDRPFLIGEMIRVGILIF